MFSITSMYGFLGQFRPLEQIFHRNGPLAGPEILAERDNVDQVSCVWKEAGMAQWLEHLPPASVARVRCLDSASDVGPVNDGFVVGSRPCSERFSSG